VNPERIPLPRRPYPFGSKSTEHELAEEIYILHLEIYCISGISESAPRGRTAQASAQHMALQFTFHISNPHSSILVAKVVSSVAATPIATPHGRSVFESGLEST
jgi:hypothetical protein